MLAIDGLDIGGAEMVVRDIARSLDRDRFDVCICCTKGLGRIGRQLVAEGLDVFVLPGQKEGKVDYFTSLKLRRAVAERGIDVLHTHATSAFFDASVCRLSTPGLKAVHTFHYGNYPFVSWRHRILEGMCTRAVDRLIAVGLEQRRGILTTYRLSESKMDVAWNGVTLQPPSSASSFRAKVGTGDRLLVGSISTLIPQKGLDDFLEVARLCRDAGRHMQFVIVGGGPLQPMLEQRRHELGLDDSVVITGWIENAAAVALPAFDVFFQTSRWEAMSIAVLEAMGHGKPIVATRVGDNPHVIEEGVSGVLVDGGNTVAMADALARMTDDGLRQRLGAAARERFRNHFTLEHMIGRYEDLYQELVSR